MIKHLLAWLGFHVHHWGIVHLIDDPKSAPGWKGKKFVQTCYECGKVRPVRMRLV